MTYDLVVRGARIRGREREGTLDLAVREGMIAQVGRNLDRGRLELPALGCLVAPPFVEPHLHLDRVLSAEGPGEILPRARQVLEQAVCHGTTFVRAHVDVSTRVGLGPVRALVDLRSQLADLLDIQLVAFPRDGIVQDPGVEALLDEALQEGADAVGGRPDHERTPDDARRHVDACFEVALRHDADVDVHVDEDDDPASRTLALLADATIRHGWEGRVTAGHACALSAYPDAYASRVIGMLEQAGISVVVCPATDARIPRIRDLQAAGVNVACGQDGVKDPSYPVFGQADPLEVGFLLAHATRMDASGVDALFDAVTSNAAKVPRLRGYGLEPGCRASFNVLACNTVQEVFRTRPDRIVVRDGKVIARTQTERSLCP